MEYKVVNLMNDGTLVYMLGQAIVVVLVAPLVAGLIKTSKARMQNRRGPSIFQSYFDFLKLFAKDSVISPTTSWIFTVAPYVYFASALGAAAMTPVLAALFTGFSSRFADLFMLLYLFVLGRFFLALASLDAGGTFGGMGGSREMFISVLVEPAILLTLLTVAFKSHSTGLGAMTATAEGSSLGLAAIFAAAAFFIVLVAETGRVPVDNPDTHLELTMIHEGMILEYSGRSLGLIAWASSIKQLVMIILFVTLFLPWPGATWPLAGQILAMIGKVLACVVALALMESVTNKIRLFRVPGFLAVAGLFALLAIVAQ